jgi:RNA polymerase sigma-70 factor (ECF subfamily)
MVEATSHTQHVEGCLARLQTGDRTALDDLLRHVYERLQRLARRMLKGYPGVKRWAQTDDVLQNAVVRLLRALQDVPIVSARDFFGLSTEQIRRELIDLARRYYGPLGVGANHATSAEDYSQRSPHYELADRSLDPAVLAAWCEFHEQVQELPVDEREVVGLLYYQGLKQAEAARILHVTIRTVQRRWHAALLKLHHIFKGQEPGW